MTDLTLEALAAQVLAQREAAVDLIADTTVVTLDEPEDGDEGSPNALLVDLPDGVREYKLDRYAANQISETLQIPFRLWERLDGTHPDLLANLANGLLSREPKRRMIRTLGTRARAFLSDRYRPRDNWALLEHLLPIFNEHQGVVFKKCQLTDTRMYVKTTLPFFERQITPAVGDVIHGGVVISNSEIGAGSLYIYPYTDRLICTNGAIHTTFGQRRIHVGRRIESTEEAYEFYSDATMQLDDAAFFAKCSDTLRACLNETVFDAIADQMRDLAAIRIPGSPVENVKVIARAQNLTEDEGASVLQHLIEGGNLTAWGYVNGITATARDHESADRQAELEIAAGKMIADPDWATALAVA